MPKAKTTAKTAMFWNMQRLGKTTAQERTRAMQTIRKTRVQPGRMFCCELLAGSTDLRAQNLTYRKKNAYQLCYGAQLEDGTNIQLQLYVPQASQAYRDAGYKGGNDFTQLCDRAVGYAGRADGVELFIFHAPASNNAVKTVSFLVSHLVERYGGPVSQNPAAQRWMVLGDFNVTPDKLKKSKVPLPWDEYILAGAVPTHPSRTRDSTLDYALCNYVNTIPRPTIVPVRISPRLNPSDHRPFQVTFAP
jgi:hypothetical protein